MGIKKSVITTAGMKNLAGKNYDRIRRSDIKHSGESTPLAWFEISLMAKRIMRAKSTTWEKAELMAKKELTKKDLLEGNDITTVVTRYQLKRKALIKIAKKVE